MMDIKQFLMDLLPEIDFENEEHLITDGIMTSVDIVNIVINFMETFGAEVPLDKIHKENFESLKDIQDFLGQFLDKS